ncbi:MAG: Bax inhibitor-1 family protein [Candidatus Obscuribacterales bacterium]|nr:Bax inhibitor-1 family protein [Candidatus Obscuribacterales bacterium]
MPNMENTRTSTLFAKVSLLLTGSMLASGAGTFIGMSMSGIGFFIFSLIAFFGLAIAVAVAAKTAPPTVAVGLLGAFSFAAGLFIGPAISMYVAQLGAQTVGLAYLGTGGIMAVCGVIATLSGINFGKMERYLMLGLFGLIIVGLIGLFTGMSFGVNVLYSLAGMAIFTGYFLVDFYRLANSSDNSWGEAVSITTQIFMDFLNVLLYLLRFLALFAGKSDD